MFTTSRLSVAAATFLAATTALVSAQASLASASTVRTCVPHQLSAKFTFLGAGAGQRYATLTLTNKSGVTCRTGGYVGLVLLNGAGHPVATHDVRVDRADVRTIYLRPGAKTTARLHWSVVNGTGDTPTGPCFRAPRGVRIYPPNSYTPITTAWRMGTVCERGTINIWPLVR